MRMKLVAASILALGLAGSAYAQSNPAPSNLTMDKNQADYGGGAKGDPNTNTPKLIDPSSTGSTKSGSTMSDGSVKCQDPVNNSAKLQTQGGTSDATPMDEACAAHNN